MRSLFLRPCVVRTLGSASLSDEGVERELVLAVIVGGGAVSKVPDDVASVVLPRRKETGVIRSLRRASMP